jgi:Golgi nucleoside diphosphatase
MSKNQIAKGARVAGTVNGTDFTGTVTGVVYRNRKCLVSVLFDQQVDVLHGFVSEHRFTPQTLRVIG